MQIEQRRDFLAPLQSTGDQCWQILLWIYCGSKPSDRSAQNIAEAVKLPPSTAERFLHLLEECGYLNRRYSQQHCEIELTFETRHQIELLLTQMAYAASPDGS